MNMLGAISDLLVRIGWLIALTTVGVSLWGAVPLWANATLGALCIASSVATIQHIRKRR